MPTATRQASTDNLSTEQTNNRLNSPTILTNNTTAEIILTIHGLCCHGGYDYNATDGDATNDYDKNKVNAEMRMIKSA